MKGLRREDLEKPMDGDEQGGGGKARKIVKGDQYCGGHTEWTQLALASGR